MKLKFLGTGAADWSPKYKSRDEYRRYASVLIDDELLIDPGPHILDFETDFGYKSLYDRAENILLTHSHSDHLDICVLKQLCIVQHRDIWCEKGAVSELESNAELTVHEIPLLREFKVGEYTVTALPANHRTDAVDEQPVHFIIEKDDKRIFYGCDGAWFMQETWYHMKKFTFDLIILDGTLGDAEGDNRIFEHNNLHMTEIMSESIRKEGMLKDGGKIFISHLSRYSHGTQQDVEKRLKPSDIKVAYDNLEVII